MPADVQPREKVGVIVIHGVGETTEGWIDSYLVPQLETFRAYDNVAGLKRRPKTSDLLLVARTKDNQFIAIGLEHDDDFRNACRAIASEGLADKDPFATTEARKKNRDALWRELRGVLDETNASELLAELQAANVPCCIAFNPTSEVNHVRDPESSEQTSTWASFTRRCALDDRDVIVSELYWADMSKIGYTNMSRSSAIVQLFLESPFVLGESLLKGSEHGIHWAIARLISVSNWLMRWPIAGLTLPVFLTAFAVLAVQQLLPIERLPATVAAILGVISVLAFAFFRQAAHRKVGLADLSLSTAVFAFLLIIAVAIYAFTAPSTALENPNAYLVFGFLLLMASWYFWTLATVSAAGLVTLTALKRLVLPGARKPPLARASLAISLNLLLGMVWKLILPLVGVLTINLLFQSNLDKSAARRGMVNAGTCPDAGSVEAFTVVKVDSVCQLAWVKEFLVEVSLLNAGAILAICVVVAILLAVRGSIARTSELLKWQKAISLPRLITSPWIVATLFAVACFNAVVAFTPGLHLPMPAHLDGSFGVGASALGLVVLVYFVQRLIEMSNSYVHIGRDLVDHQYGASYRPLTTWLLPPEKEEAETTAEGFKTYRRRRRIQRRLEALIDEVIAQQQIGRLIFLAHSQGTVIMHDYLDNHDNLVAKSHEDRQSLFEVQRIDVVTVGSPLTHLYRYYFADYEAQPGGTKPHTLMRKVGSWSNMWRIDDPIGQDVNFLDGIENSQLGRGGHMDYWREEEVCRKVWALVCETPQAPSLVHTA